MSGLTVAEAAKLMNVSERTVYMARALIRSGRDDLIAAAEAGTMTLNAALIEAGIKSKSKPAILQKMQRAYLALPAFEQAEFVAWLGGEIAGRRAAA